ncbi:MAG: hypothetical protein FJZ38_14895 [Candidatus Rokubacteria bacterium]|nr:hypothetical protein [Candidatus Rokubacteria bacterium]
MEQMTLSSAVRPLAEYVAELGEDVVVLTKRRRPVLALVPLRGVDRETLALSCNADFMRMLARSRARFAAGKRLSLDEMKRRFSGKTRAKRRKRLATAYGR